jgi:hypothetical protein
MWESITRNSPVDIDWNSLPGISPVRREIVSSKDRQTILVQKPRISIPEDGLESIYFMEHSSNSGAHDTVGCR